MIHRFMVIVLPYPPLSQLTTAPYLLFITLGAGKSWITCGIFRQHLNILYRIPTCTITTYLFLMIASFEFHLINITVLSDTQLENRYLFHLLFRWKYPKMSYTALFRNLRCAIKLIVLQKKTSFAIFLLYMGKPKVA